MLWVRVDDNAVAENRLLAKSFSAFERIERGRLM